MFTEIRKKIHFFNIIIFLQALLASLGSLYFEHFGDFVKNFQSRDYFNTANGFEPCYLCRWVRILMYPIVWFSLIGIATGDRKMAKSLAWVSAAGMLLSLYEHLTETTQFFATTTFCQTHICNLSEIKYFGFLTMPMLGVIAFLVIFICSLAVIHLAKKEQAMHDELANEAR